jgi:hypothetical protein
MKPSSLSALHLAMQKNHTPAGGPMTQRNRNVMSENIMFYKAFWFLTKNSVFYQALLISLHVVG